MWWIILNRPKAGKIDITVSWWMFMCIQMKIPFTIREMVLNYTLEKLWKCGKSIFKYILLLNKTLKSIDKCIIQSYALVSKKITVLIHSKGKGKIKKGKANIATYQCQNESKQHIFGHVHKY